MAVLNPPIAVASRTDHAADDFRGALMAGMTPASGVLPRSGILPGWGAELSVAQRATPGMGVLVGAGVVVVTSGLLPGHGGYYVINDASLDVAITAAHATLARTDLVIARVADPQYHTGGDGNASIKVITGTAGAGVPAVPAAEGAYVVLAQVAVAAAASSIVNANITQNTAAARAYTVAAGGILPVANAAARTALTPYLGQHVVEIDTFREYVWDGSGSWQLVTGGWVNDSSGVNARQDTAPFGLSMTQSRVYRQNRRVRWEWAFGITSGTGVAARVLVAPPTSTLPVVGGAADVPIGVGTIYKGSYYPCQVVWDPGTGHLAFRRQDAPFTAPWGQDPAIQLASGDAITGHAEWQI